jgi:hypothetical protein
MSLRSEVDRLKAKWRFNIDHSASGNRSGTVQSIIRQALWDTAVDDPRTAMGGLWACRHDPWASPVVCAAFEFAVEEGCEAVFDGVWNQVEVRGEFKCRRTEVPPEISLASALRAGN